MAIASCTKLKGKRNSVPFIGLIIQSRGILVRNRVATPKENKTPFRFIGSGIHLGCLVGTEFRLLA